MNRTTECARSAVSLLAIAEPMPRESETRT
jgi:hypothetical protein